MKSNKQRETYPNGYNEPKWLWNLEQKFPRPSEMWRRSFTGAGIATIACSFAFKSELCFVAGVGLLAQGVMWRSGRDFQNPGLSDEPPLMMLKWIQQKARADARAGMPWDAEEKAELRKIVEWSGNWSENHADEVLERREHSFSWRILKAVFKIELRPKIAPADRHIYEASLLAEIERAELDAKEPRAPRRSMKDPVS